MNKKKFLKIFEMCIADEDIGEITITVSELMRSKRITFGRDKFNEKYEYYKNNCDNRMRLKPYEIDQIVEIDFTTNE
ncbi:MAG: hypothetical protein ACLTK7_08455 [Clostridium paraputrificum]